MSEIKDTATTQSPLKAYQTLAVGRGGLLALVRYELAELLSQVPGAPGHALRRALTARLLGLRARKLTLGRAVTIRSPHRCRFGERVVLDDLCSLDAFSEHDDAISIGDRVVLARNTTVSAKGGRVTIGARVGVGANGVIHAPVGASVTIGDDTVIAPGVIIGGSNYNTDDPDIPIASQGYRDHTGVVIGSGCWLGARVTVLDGVTIGDGAVVGAGAIVTADIPSMAIAVGVPARVVKMRAGTPKASERPFPHIAEDGRGDRDEADPSAEHGAA
ncbi:MAG: DapH/DapD/GlmU-related protein [Phycisphaerales bacterium JB040]